MTHKVTVLITYDDPECGGVVDAFINDLERNMSELKSDIRICVEELAIKQGNLHHRMLADYIKDVDECDLENVYVFSLLKDDASEEFLKISELCATSRSVPLKK